MIDDPNIHGLQQLWLRQLQLEFEQICMDYRLHLRPPIFEISDAKRQLGIWCPDTRTIRLSSHLISTHSWSVTLQVLKHEMAHQLCSEEFHSRDVAHGKDFQQACLRLGVLPEYRRAGATMVEMVEQVSGHTQITAKGRECLLKVEKLLALSHSSNEHEAALAIQKANELIGKYHLSELGDNRQYRFGVGIIDRKRKRIESYQRHICTILHDFFFVRIVLASRYDPLKGVSYKTIEILGTKENVTIAEYCYHFLENRLDSLWRLNRHRFKGSARTEKNSYYLGLLRGFYQKLEEQKQKRETSETRAQFGDLVIIEERQLENFVGMCFPRLRKAAKTGAKVYRATYNEGVRTGKNISFAEGLAANEQSSGRFLPR